MNFFQNGLETLDQLLFFPRIDICTIRTESGGDADGAG